MGLTQIKQLDGLMQTVSAILSDSTASLHESMLEECRVSLAQIQQQANASTQAGLIQGMAQDMDKQQQAVLTALELPLKSLHRLTQDGQLSEHQKA